MSQSENPVDNSKRGIEGQRDALRGKQNFPAAHLIIELAKDGLLDTQNLSPREIEEALAPLTPREKVYAIIQHFVPQERRCEIEMPERETSAVDTEGLEVSEQDKGYIKELVSWIQEFANAPIIHDSFGEDHPARGAWRKSLGDRMTAVTGDKNIGDYFELVVKYNRLRTNYYSRIMEACSTLSFILGEYPHLSEIQQAADELLQSIPPECTNEVAYRAIPQEEKVEIARQVGAKAEAFVQLVLEASQAD